MQELHRDGDLSLLDIAGLAGVDHAMYVAHRHASLLRLSPSILLTDSLSLWPLSLFQLCHLGIGRRFHRTVREH